MFTQTLMVRLEERFLIGHEVMQAVAAELENKIAPPKKSEAATPLPVDRLRRENANLLRAFHKVLESMPRFYLPEPVQFWLDAPPSPDADQHGEEIRQILQQLEARLNDNQLSQLYAGTITFFDVQMQRSQALPINWDGMRFRILAAAQEDLTPRGHLNYFCSYAARVIEICTAKGYQRAELRLLVEDVMQEARLALRAELQAAIAARFHQALHDLTDSLRAIHALINHLLRNLQVLIGKPEVPESVTSTVTNLEVKNAKLAGMMQQLHDVGIQLPPGLESRLKGVIDASRALSHYQSYMDSPRRIQEFLQRVDEVKREARGISLEFRRIRRKTMSILKTVAPSAAAEIEQEIKPLRIYEQPRRLLIEVSRELLWALQDLNYLLEQPPSGPANPVPDSQERNRLKVLARELVIDNPDYQDLESAITASVFDPLRIRMAGKKMLDATMRLLQPPPPPRGVEVAEMPEPLLTEAISDLAEAYQRLSVAVEGEERQKLQELPGLLLEFQQTLGALDSSRVIHVNITAALERETKSQKGVVHQPVAVRLDNLLRPLRELFKSTLDIRHPSQELWNLRTRAMRIMEVSYEVDQERSWNHLAEIAIIPLIQIFEPYDPRYGRSRSELEKRLQQGPVPGLLPAAVLFGARRRNSLEDLGNPEFSKRMHQRAHNLVNRSGLVGEVLGLHPLWLPILASDEAMTLAAELRPLFENGLGSGLVARILNDNEEYQDLNRIDQAEKEGETGLMLEAITNPNGFINLRRVLFEGICWLVNRELASEFRKNQQGLLYNQREFLRSLNVEDPVDLLKPMSAFKNTEQMNHGILLLQELGHREMELCLLQWLHRRFLQLPLLVSLLQDRFPDFSEVAKVMPELLLELQLRYQWSCQNIGQTAERRSYRWLLQELGQGDHVERIEKGLALQSEIREQLEFLKTISMDHPKGVLGMIKAFFKGTNRYAAQMRKSMRLGLRQLERLGFAREYRLLTLELNRLSLPSNRPGFH